MKKALIILAMTLSPAVYAGCPFDGWVLQPGQAGYVEQQTCLARKGYLQPRYHYNLPPQNFNESEWRDYSRQVEAERRRETRRLWQCFENNDFNCR